MYNFYDDYKDPISEIENVKNMYYVQVQKVKQEKYIENLLFADYVRKVKTNLSRYDHIKDMFSVAQKQIDKKGKKEKEQLKTIESLIKKDFLNNDNNFNLINIIRGGWEAYYYDAEFEGYGLTFRISIPMMNNIDVRNFDSANKGMFAFTVKESEYCWSVKKMSYKIEDIAVYIKGYFANVLNVLIGEEG